MTDDLLRRPMILGAGLLCVTLADPAQALGRRLNCLPEIFQPLHLANPLPKSK
jgi:hypothetical protein